MPRNLDQYVARLCWNSKGWVQPTGEAAASESGTYAAQMRFGHEEWLFDAKRVIDGWRYGFLEPVHKSWRGLEGKTIDVRLYALSPDRRRYYVGHLPACEILSEESAGRARRIYAERGWLKEMTAQVSQLGGKIEGLGQKAAVNLLNVRFKPTEAFRYDPMVPVGPGERLWKLPRYTLVKLSGDRKVILREWASRVGTTKLRPTGRQVRGAVGKREVDLRHSQLQNELFEALSNRYGKDAVAMEEGFADLRVRKDGRDVLIEVKSDPRPRFAVREALGQLLEYAYVAERHGRKVAELIVAGPGELEPSDRKYMAHLREARGLPIRYLCVRKGAGAFDI